jgi:hypothetical protein
MFIRLFEIETPWATRALTETRICANCGQRFSPTWKWNSDGRWVPTGESYWQARRYCSRECFWTRPVGKVIDPNLIEEDEPEVLA